MRIIFFLAVVIAVGIVLFKFCGGSGYDDQKIVIKIIPTSQAQSGSDVEEDQWMRELKRERVERPTATPEPTVAPEAPLEPTPEPTETPEPISEPTVAPVPPVASPPPVISVPVCGSGTLAPVHYGSRPGNVVLTFDDSVGDLSQAYAILSVLREYGVKAIFFPTGSWGARNPDLIRTMETEGHLVGSHTTDHADLTTLSVDGIKSQILGGVGSTKLARPPYGAFNNCVREVAADVGYGLMMWNVDSRDWAAASEGKTAEDIREVVVAGVLANRAQGIGSNVVMHLHGAFTVEALPMIIGDLRATGFTFENSYQ